jgi:hypothetical protein
MSVELPSALGTHNFFIEPNALQTLRRDAQLRLSRGLISFTRKNYQKDGCVINPNNSHKADPRRAIACLYNYKF